MRAKEYLEQIRQGDIKVKQLIKEFAGIKDSQITLSGIDYSKDRVQHSVNNAAYTRLVEKQYDLQLEINASIDNYISFKHKVIQQIQALGKADYIDILYKRYVEYESFEQISTEISLSYYHTVHIHGEALEAFENKFLKVSK